MTRKEAKELAVVVGATGAFGTKIVGTLTGHGLDVVAVARTAGSLDDLRERYPTVRTCIADIASDSSIDAIKSALDRPVRIAVHGPGVAVAGGVLTAKINAVIDAVNIKAGGMMRLARAVDNHISRHGRLVAIGGHYGLEPTAYAAAAGTANAALMSVTRQLSLAYGPRGVTAHLIAPGPADTERLHRIAAERAASSGASVEQFFEELRAESSLNQLTTPEQVAWAVGLLLAQEADVLTGSTLMLDAGRRRGMP